MTKKIFRYIFIVFLLNIFLSISTYLYASNNGNKPTNSSNTINVVFLSGIGCHNCAVVDPIIFTKATKDYPNLIVFEYEIYHDGKANADVKSDYFKTYYPNRQGGVPFIILSKEKNYMGRIEALKGLDKLSEITSNDFPLPKGSSLSFEDLDISKLPGKIKIWTKNRVLISGGKGTNKDLKAVLLSNNISETLKNIKYKEIAPMPVEISLGKINFEYAVKIDDWILQWNGEPLTVKKGFHLPDNLIAWILITIVIIAFLLSIFKIKISWKGIHLEFMLQGKVKDTLIAGCSLVSLIIFFYMAKNISPEFLQHSGYILPLPIFTFLIAIVDGFNPCNMFVLTCLLALLIATSDSKKRLYVVSLSFVLMVFIIYFLFMATWLNVFKYLSFVTPLRISIAILALIAGFINCKELLFFKKGVSLMIPEKQHGPLMRKIEAMKDVIRTGSMPILISSSLGLAALSSFIELPCTAGFPIIYTTILSGKHLNSGLEYYMYLLLYNVVYVMPLLVIITFFIYTLKSKRISQRQVEIIKFIGGFIMILLGITLLVNPALVGLSFG